jgi:hypothetical protein
MKNLHHGFLVYRKETFNLVNILDLYKWYNKTYKPRLNKFRILSNKNLKLICNKDNRKFFTITKNSINPVKLSSYSTLIFMILLKGLLILINSLIKLSNLPKEKPSKKPLSKFKKIIVFYKTYIRYYLKVHNV